MDGLSSRSGARSGTSRTAAGPATLPAVSLSLGAEPEALASAGTSGLAVAGSGAGRRWSSLGATGSGTADP